MAGVETIAVAPARVALVDAWKLSHQVVEVLAPESRVRAAQIESPAAQACSHGGGVTGKAFGIGQSRRRFRLHHISHDSGAVVPGIHHMEHVAGVGVEPTQCVRSATALHHANMGPQGGIPGQQWLSAHRAFHAERQWRNGKEHMPARHHEVVRHAGMRRFERL
ncbi:hypothetical protein D3C71_987280 [compost metagenome]